MVPSARDRGESTSRRESLPCSARAPQRLIGRILLHILNDDGPAGIERAAARRHLIIGDSAKCSRNSGSKPRCAAITRTLSSRRS